MEQSVNNHDIYMSDGIDQLATALAKAQSEFTTAKKNKMNPHFKSQYADFESIVEASRPALTKNGLSVVQIVYCDTTNGHYLVTILLHSSGQWIKSKAVHNPATTNPQALMSYNTYLKRMCYSAIVGVTTGDCDDDGEASSNNYQTKQKIDKSRIDEIMSLSEPIQQRILAYNNVSSVDELTIEQYDKVISMLKNKSKQ